MVEFRSQDHQIKHVKIMKTDAQLLPAIASLLES